MIDGKPDWYRLGELPISDVRMMNDADKLTFIKALCEMTDHSMNEEYVPEKMGGFVGRAIDRQFDIMRSGVDSYMRSVHANPSGKSKNTLCLPYGYPMGRHRLPKTEQNRSEEETEQNRTEQIEETEQIRTELIRSGYSIYEIDQAIDTVKDWQGIRNKTGYIIQTIKNQRKRIPAQNFNQRDYSTVPDEMMAETAKEVAEFLAKEQEDERKAERDGRGK